MLEWKRSKTEARTAEQWYHNMIYSSQPQVLPPPPVLHLSLVLKVNLLQRSSGDSTHQLQLHHEVINPTADIWRLFFLLKLSRYHSSHFVVVVLSRVKSDNYLQQSS
jgi:hypothetical protein